MKAACFMLGVGGADANGVDSRLLSPLHLVALFNRPDIARVLLMCGASPRLQGGVTRAAAARGGKLWSPLDMAEEACTEGGALDEGEKRTTNASRLSVESGTPPVCAVVGLVLFGGDVYDAAAAGIGRCLLVLDSRRWGIVYRQSFG